MNTAVTKNQGTQLFGAQSPPVTLWIIADIEHNEPMI